MVLLYALSSWSEVGLVHVHVHIFACTCSTKFNGKVKGFVLAREGGALCVLLWRDKNVVDNVVHPHHDNPHVPTKVGLCTRCEQFSSSNQKQLPFEQQPKIMRKYASNLAGPKRSICYWQRIAVLLDSEPNLSIRRSNSI